MTPEELEHSHVEVDDRLWIGGAQAPIPAAAASVVTLHRPARPVPDRVHQTIACFSDSRFQPVPAPTVQHAVEAVRSAWPDSGVLVRCLHGLNRSALIVALTLRERGVVPSTVIGRIQAARPGSLNNPYFVDLIHTWPNDPMGSP